jgi:hypothetical protein
MSDVTLENYPDLRDLTRSISEDVQARIGAYIEALSPQFRPSTALGSFVVTASRSTGQDSPKNAASAFTQFVGIFKEIATKLGLDTKLGDAIEMNYAMPVVFPFTYPHSISSPAGAKRVMVTAPLRFVLSLPGYPFDELRTLVTARGPKDRLAEFALHYAVMNFVVMQNKRLLRVFEDLRFPIRSEVLEEFGPLPITTINAPTSTIRPSDKLITQITRFSGSDTAEELVDLDSWTRFPDPLADRFRTEAAKYSIDTGSSA